MLFSLGTVFLGTISGGLILGLNYHKVSKINAKFLGQMKIINDKYNNLSYELFFKSIDKNTNFKQKQEYFINKEKDVMDYYSILLDLINNIKNHPFLINLKFNKSYLSEFQNNFSAEFISIFNSLKKIDEDQVIENQMKKINNFLIESYNYLKIVSFKYEDLASDLEKIYLLNSIYDYYAPIINLSKNTGLLKTLNTISNQNYQRKTERVDLTPKGESDKNYFDLWELFQNNAFKDFKNGREKYLLDIYSTNFYGKSEISYIPAAKDKKNNQCSTKQSGCYNREHIVVQSSFKPILTRLEKEGDKEEIRKAYNMRHDAHHIYPVDGATNSLRNNHPHDIVVKDRPQKNIKNNARFGLNSIDRTVYEPDDFFKGNVARSIFYFGMHFRDYLAQLEPRITVFNSNTIIKEQYIKTYLEWDQEVNPVNVFDLYKNEAIFDFQKNRNPFIDIPHLAKYIFDASYANKKLQLYRMGF